MKVTWCIFQKISYTFFYKNNIFLRCVAIKIARFLSISKMIRVLIQIHVSIVKPKVSNDIVFNVMKIHHHKYANSYGYKVKRSIYFRQTNCITFMLAFFFDHDDFCTHWKAPGILSDFLHNKGFLTIRQTFETSSNPSYMRTFPSHFS